MNQLKSIQVENFENAYAAWRCAFVHAIARTVAIKKDGEWHLLSAFVELTPTNASGILLGLVETSTLRVAAEKFAVKAPEIDQFISQIRQGRLLLPDCSMTLPGEKFAEYAPTPFPVHQYTTPQIEVRGDRADSIAQGFNYQRADSDLRANATPFDGMTDVLSYFGLGNQAHLPIDASIVLRLHPPVDLLLAQTSLSLNRLTVHLFCKSEFASTDISLGLRLFPDPVISRRMQVAHCIVWKTEANGFNSGVLEIDVPEAAAVVVMLTAGGQSVRQAFIGDPAKSLNVRLQDYRAFDPELEYLRKGLHVAKGDTRSLEAAVATLLHLYGATAVTPPTSDTPDILVETPLRKLAIVECTIAFNDLRDKVGKLVGRRDVLVQSHKIAGIQREVLAVLVVNTQPLITPADNRYLIEQQVALVTRADLDAAFLSLDVPKNLDAIYDNKVEMLQRLLAGMDIIPGGI